MRKGQVRAKERIRQKSKTTSGRKNGNSHIDAMGTNIKGLLKKLKEYDMTFDDWSKDTFLFGVNAPVGQFTPNRHLQAIEKAENLPHITFHGLRHSHVSYLISKGLNAYEVAERIGDRVEMVLQVYGHMFPNPQKNIVKVLNQNFDFINEKNDCGSKCGSTIL